MKYFKRKDANYDDHDDLDVLQERLRDVLDKKIKAYKLFYGSHLVDPDFSLRTTQNKPK